MSSVFNGTSGPHDASIAIVGEAYGSDEAAAMRPFVGSSGKLLDQLIASAGLRRDDCFVTNVANVRPDRNQMWKMFAPRSARSPSYLGLHPLPETKRHIDNLNTQLSSYPRKLIICCGNYPLWAVTNKADLKYQSSFDGVKLGTEGRVVPTGIGKWRGSMIYATDNTTPVLPIYHPAAINRDWSSYYVTQHDLKTRVPQALNNDWRPRNKPSLRFSFSFEESIASLEALKAALDRASGGLSVAIDIETARQKIITCIGFAYTANDAFTIPFVKLGGESFVGCWYPPQERRIVDLLVAILNHHNLRAVGQNFLYDAQFIYDHWGVRVDFDFDTLTAQHVLFPGTPKSLDYLSSLYCKYHWYWKDDNKNWDLKGSMAEHLRYNAEDCLRTYEIATHSREAIVKAGLQTQWEFARDRRRLALDLMLKGARIDTKRRHKFKIDVMMSSENRQSRLLTMIPQSMVQTGGKTTWITSPKQQQIVFHELLGLPVQRNRKTKNATLSKEALLVLESKAPELYPIFKCLRDLRSLEVFASTFINTRLSNDERMRCFYGDAETFRWTSSENAFGGGGNLQNIPSGDEGKDLPNIRELFIPDPGCTIVDCDLSGADAQVVAWEADDEELKTAFRKGMKVHAKNAIDIFGARFVDAAGDTGDKATPKGRLYDKCKRAVHATNYGAHFRTLVQNPDIAFTPREAETFQHQWLHILHPGIGRWQRRVNEGLLRSRTITNKYGYRRVYFERVDDAMLREALAWGPQSTVALTCFRGALNVRTNCPFVDILLQVHDSLVFQLPTRMVASHLPSVLKHLHNPIPYDDPLTIPWGVKLSDQSWGHCKKWESDIK
jgi:uracil-DNA glycosylase family 4